jgi:hypothetical protein
MSCGVCDYIHLTFTVHCSLIADHETFEAELRGRQSDVDDATKGRKRPEPNENGATTDAKGGKGPKKPAPQYVVKRRLRCTPAVFIFSYLTVSDEKCRSSIQNRNS